MLIRTECEYDNVKTPYFGSNLSGQLFDYNFFYRIIPSENNAIKRYKISYDDDEDISETFQQKIINTYNDNNQPLVSSVYQNDALVTEVFYEYY